VPGKRDRQRGGGVRHAAAVNPAHPVGLVAHFFIARAPLAGTLCQYPDGRAATRQAAASTEPHTANFSWPVKQPDAGLSIDPRGCGNIRGRTYSKGPWGMNKART